MFLKLCQSSNKGSIQKYLNSYSEVKHIWLDLWVEYNVEKYIPCPSIPNDELHHDANCDC